MERAIRTSFWRSFAGSGLLLGAVFFAASLTPSLIPRSFPLQGVLAGICFALGYGFGVFALWLWKYLEFPIPNARLRQIATFAAAVVAIVIVVSFLWRAAEWQNSIRTVMGMPPVDSAHPLEVGLLAAVVAVVLIMLARLFRGTLRMVSRPMKHIAPGRGSLVIGLMVTAGLFAIVINGVLFKMGLRIADKSLQAMDDLLEPGIDRPADSVRTGSSASLVDWEDLGRAGREFVSSGPSRADIEAFLGPEALEPIRVYIGLNCAGSPEERADLALRELIRVGGFDRSVLVVVVPTGTGWIDPAALDTLDYLHRGDVASVAVQYSYLLSWISLLVEPGYGSETGRALFRTIYNHGTGLPKNARPRLYLHGLSLGALSAEQSVRFYEMLGDPIHGALFAGPPFATPGWRSATAEREPGSPAWLPRFEDGAIIRFTNQENALDIPGVKWGPVRIVYLQYASDPVTFFDPTAIYRRPAWMTGPRGADVSPELRWYPVVTFMQLLLDMVAPLSVPIGHGHLYAHAHYIDAWQAVTAPEDWTPAETARLKALFAK